MFHTFSALGSIQVYRINVNVRGGKSNSFGLPSTAYRSSGHTCLSDSNHVSNSNVTIRPSTAVSLDPNVLEESYTLSLRALCFEKIALTRSAVNVV